MCLNLNTCLGAVLQCFIGVSRPIITVPTDSAFLYTSASRYHSAGSIPPSSSWVSIVYGKLMQFPAHFERTTDEI